MIRLRATPRASPRPMRSDAGTKRCVERRRPPSRSRRHPARLGADHAPQRRRSARQEPGASPADVAARGVGRLVHGVAAARPSAAAGRRRRRDWPGIAVPLEHRRRGYVRAADGSELKNAVKKALEVVYVALRYDLVQARRGCHAKLGLADLALIVARSTAGQPLRQHGIVPFEVAWPTWRAAETDPTPPTPSDVFAAVAIVTTAMRGTDWVAITA